LTILFEGLRLLFINWRLTLIQMLPAMWIWVAMLDLKAHVLHGQSFHAITGLVVIPGIFVLALGLTLQAGTTSAVKAVKMSAKLLPGHQPADRDPPWSR
jgi:hypothetical protein